MKRWKAKEDRRVAGRGEAGVFQKGRKRLLSGVPLDNEHNDIEETEYAGYDTSYFGRLRFLGGGFASIADRVNSVFCGLRLGFYFCLKRQR